MLRTVLVTGILTTALIGCAQPTRTPPHVPGSTTSIMFDYAHNIDEVRERVRVPLAGIIDLPNGNKLWTFSSTGSATVPMSSPTLGVITGANGMPIYYQGNSTQWVQVDQSCIVQAEVKADGSLVRGTWQGNGCP